MLSFWFSACDRDWETIELPFKSTILSVDNQHGVLCLWALVDPEYSKKKTRIIIVGTGQPLPDSFIGTFVGTVIVGPLIWHVFEDLSA